MKENKMIKMEVSGFRFITDKGGMPSEQGRNECVEAQTGMHDLQLRRGFYVTSC